MIVVSYLSDKGKRYSFRFQRLWDACLFAGNVERNGGTEVTITEEQQ